MFFICVFRSTNILPFKLLNQLDMHEILHLLWESFPAFCPDYLFFGLMFSVLSSLLLLLCHYPHSRSESATPLSHSSTSRQTTAFGTFLSSLCDLFCICIFFFTLVTELVKLPSASFFSGTNHAFETI